MKSKSFLFPGIFLYVSLLIPSISADFAFAKSYTYQSPEKSHVAKDQTRSGVNRAAKNRQEALKLSAAWRERANKHIQKGNFLEAVKAATQAIGYDQSQIENYFIRARAFTGLGNFTKANQDIQNVLVMYPNSSEAYNAFGEIAEKARNIGAAKKYYEKSCGMTNSAACNSFERLTQGVAGNPDAEFNNASNSEDFERFIDAYKPDELAFIAVQRLAKPYIKVRDWNGAAAIFQKYQRDFPAMQKRFANIISVLMSPEENLDMRNIGAGVNTEKGEYNPVITADSSKLYFGRDRGNDAGGEDIYVADLEDAQWSKAVNFGPPVNTETHEVPLSISADGNTMALFGNYAESFGRGDIFYTDKTTNCWTNIKHYPAPINSEHFDSNAMYTADGKSILLVSERPGGVGDYHKKDDFYHGSYGGNTDIYVYTPNENGDFDLINLGSTINTPYSEYSPFLHPDGKTLYFSSDGHYGIGGLDVFVSVRLSDTSWTEWSEPINLGKEINSPNNDWGYQITTAGDWAYFSVADRLEGFGANDIYMSQLPKIARPRAVITITGKVTDPDGNSIDDVQIRWNDIAKQKEVGEAKSDPQTGKYFIALPSGRLYGYYAEKEGYMGRSEEVDLTDKLFYGEYNVDIMMYPVGKIREEKFAIRLNNVFFDFNKWDLKPESSFELDRWVTFLNGQPDITAEIHGHTDSTGPDAYNLSLSNKRAAAVVNYLVRKGIGKNRLVPKGFGEGRPVATNDTKDGRELNRRVEIQFNGMSQSLPVPQVEEIVSQSAPEPDDSEVLPDAADQNIESESQQDEAAATEQKLQEIRDNFFTDAIVGSWSNDDPNNMIKSTFNADGTATMTTKAISQDGTINSKKECTWDIKDAQLIYSVVKSSGDIEIAVGTHYVDAIDLLDDTNLVLISSDGSRATLQKNK
jgi:outer membrane protein OmpA-like peptidoglycan-associated protein/tetratricopeptide (TPR) repeat protein